MSGTRFSRWHVLGLALVLAGLLLAPAAGEAQTVTGQANAVQATVFGMTTVLAPTGALADSDDARAASQLSGAIPFLGGAESLHTATVSSIYGWDSLDEVASEASLANLVVTVAGNQISVEFVMAQALAPVGAASTGTSIVEGLTVNGAPVFPSGAPNETFVLPGATLVLNEVRTSAGGTTVNALRITTLDGLVDLLIASATAGIGSAGSTLIPTLSMTGLGF